MNNLLIILRSTLLISLLAYLTVILLTYFFADRVMFQPQPSSYSAAKQYFFLTDATGVKIAAVYLSNAKAKYTILYSHGNGEDLGDIYPWLQVMQEQGFAVLSYDYPGYGLSAGKPSAEGAVAAVTAAYDYLVRDLRVPPETIILHGYSVGGGPSAELAAAGKGAGLVLESSFTTAFRTVTRIALFPFDRFPVVERLAKLRIPVLVIHGKKDKIIRFFHGAELFTTAPGPKANLWVEKGGHWDLRDEAGEAYWDAWRHFLTLLEHKSPAAPRNEKPTGGGPI